MVTKHSSVYSTIITWEDRKKYCSSHKRFDARTLIFFDTQIESNYYKIKISWLILFFPFVRNKRKFELDLRFFRFAGVLSHIHEIIIRNRYNCAGIQWFTNLADSSFPSSSVSESSALPFNVEPLLLKVADVLLSLWRLTYFVVTPYK